MNDLSNTALVTLKCHVQDAQNKDSILRDRSSLKVYEYLNSILDERSKKILNNNLRKSLVKHTVLRAKKYDEYVKQFLKRNPQAVIVNIGCGLDHRFERVDNGKCFFLDLDLPDIMDIKKKIFPATKRYRQIGKSVFDYSWFDEVPEQPSILMAEGVFMYFPEEKVKSLFHEIHNRIQEAEIVFEVFSSTWLEGWRKWVVDLKIRKQLKFGKDAAFQSGISDSNDIESWSEHYKLIEDWSYFDVIKPNVKDFLRKIQWTVYYRIN